MCTLCLRFRLFPSFRYKKRLPIEFILQCSMTVIKILKIYNYERIRFFLMSGYLFLCNRPLRIFFINDYNIYLNIFVYIVYYIYIY